MSIGLYSSLSYVLVLVLVGGPVWWKTTEVSRVSLPYAQIAQMTSQVKVKVNVQLVSTDVHKDHQMGKNLQKRLQDLSHFTFLLSSRGPTLEEIRLTTEAENDKSGLDDLDGQLGKLHANVLPGTIMLFEVPQSILDKHSSPIVVGRHRLLYFSRSADVDSIVKVIKEVMLGEKVVDKVLQAIDAPQHVKPSSDQSEVLRRVTASDGYDILFSLLVPQPEKVMVEWDMEKAMQQYINPFLQSLSNFSTMSVKSQVLYLKSLNLKHRTSSNGTEVHVSASDLGVAINPVEAQLASHVSAKPRLNFLVYVPTVEQSPLYIVDDASYTKLASNAFLIPRWGGVVIYNIKDNKKSSNVDMKSVCSVFLTQMRQLLGMDTDTSVPMLTPESSELRLWERDYLYRMRTLENLVLTKVTLQALSHLLNQISNIVITDEIGEQVFLSVSSTEKALKHLDVGRLDEAFEQAKIAFVSSEKAFFDPSLLALLYFPEDQKYAIYIPLFLPVGIPVIMSIKTLFLFAKSGFKEKSD